ncbi:hypothetical protein HIM_03950 [Hirsutella minnesotensis 3608]|uniref:Beta-xylosidase n=1 Tax=Hirsutella minnesotensis 3608 TaxID=1043627 RepID=A0A0F8A680_9HYPO|nr:hypothetical protein HIM_03950 [Hirsutella minnesotensis 3608]
MMHRQQQQQQQQQQHEQQTSQSQQQHHHQHPHSHSHAQQQQQPSLRGSPVQSLNLHQLALRNPPLAHKLHQMALPLSPLVQLTTGAVHPHFPRTVLHFWLLTDAQLESLASFYHQRTPSPWSAQYPCPIVWRSDLPLEEKRRRMGKFIGLRGCDASPDMAAVVGVLRSEDEIAEEARLAAAEDEMWRRKLSPW